MTKTEPNVVSSSENTNTPKENISINGFYKNGETHHIEPVNSNRPTTTSDTPLSNEQMESVAKKIFA